MLLDTRDFPRVLTANAELPEKTCSPAAGIAEKELKPDAPGRPLFPVCCLWVMPEPWSVETGQARQLQITYRHRCGPNGNDKKPTGLHRTWALGNGKPPHPRQPWTLQESAVALGAWYLVVTATLSRPWLPAVLEAFPNFATGPSDSAT